MQLLVTSAVTLGVVGAVGFLIWLVWYAVYREGCRQADDNSDKMMSMMASGRGFAMDGNLLVDPHPPPTWLPRAAAIFFAVAGVLGLLAVLINALHGKPQEPKLDADISGSQARSLIEEDMESAEAPGLAPHETASGRPGLSIADKSTLTLEGTFMSHPSGRRKAIIKYPGGQLIVAAGDKLGESEVLQIAANQVVFQHMSQKWRLDSQNAGVHDTTGAAAQSLPGFSPSGQGKWEVSRREVLDYYELLLEEPEQLLALFESFRPLYDHDRQIRAYQVRVPGDDSFLRRAGFGDRDVVVSVNAMAMKSRQRAESLIRDFVENRTNRFVFIVQRDGATLTHEYHVR